MIIKLVRCLLALAIAIAVPAHGLAAASAAMCVALGHHGAHSADGPSSPHDHGQGQAKGGEPPQPATGNGGHCAPCVACCAAASIAPDVNVVPPLKAAAATPLRRALAPPEFHPDRLDRPPLSL